MDCVGSTLDNFAALTKAKWIHVEFRNCKGKPFADWEGSVAKPALVGARKIVADAEDALLAAHADTKKQRAALRSYVKAFNALEAKHNFIGTLEVEAIIDAFVGLAKSTKVADAANIIEDLRDF